MKHTALLFFLSIILLNSESFTQSYYPLEIGNEWVYLDHSYDYAGYDEWDTTIVKVIGDTIMPNGKKYYNLTELEFIRAEYVREDSNGIYYYEPGDSDECLFYRFDLPIDTVYSVMFGPYMSVSRIGEDQIILYGRSTHSHQFLLDGLAVCYVTLCDKFGPIGCWDYGDPPGWFRIDRTILGAVISDTVYGYVPTAVTEDKFTPMTFTLEQNYPNPFNPVTTISYTVPSVSVISLKVYDILGKEIESLINEEKTAGKYEVKWNGYNFPSGVYIYRLNAGTFTSSKKMILLR